jgi:hypothetical protein
MIIAFRRIEQMNSLNKMVIKDKINVFSEENQNENEKLRRQISHYKFISGEI